MALPFAQSSFPQMYERELVGPLFRPWVEHTFEAIALRSGERVLDVACGTGIVARLAAERVGEGGAVVGIDSSPAMLAVAREQAPAVDWRQGDAGALPIGAEERFDVVVCQQGLQFFPDKAAAVREMRRVLTPGGRVALSTWRPDEEIPFGFELRRVAERHLGPITDRRHGFGEAGPVESLLQDAGFRDVRSQTLSRTVRFADGAVFVRMNAMALLGMSGAGKDMTDEQRSSALDAIARDSMDIARPYIDAAGIAFEMRTNFTTGRADQ